MKALVYEGVQSLIYRDVADPDTHEGEAKVRIHAAGICGSDMHAYLGHDARRPAPLVFGHEAAGVIEGGPMDGTRVTINPLVPCNTCPACTGGRQNLCPERQIISLPPRAGAFADYVVMPVDNLIPVPDDMSLVKASLAEPLAVSWHAARLALEALHPSMERRAVVLGGGTIGLAASLALRAMGCEDITLIEPHPVRQSFLADVCGETVLPAADRSAPLFIDAVGIAETRATASALTDPGGIIAHIGLGQDAGGLDIRRMTLQEISFIGTYTYTPTDFRETVKAMASGQLGSLDWIETRPLADGATAFEDVLAGRVAPPKIVLEPAL